MKMTKQQGFTLLELLIAIGLTAMVAVGLSTLMESSGKAQQQYHQVETRLNEIEQALATLQSDLSQSLSRGIKLNGKLQGGSILISRPQISEAPFLRFSRLKSYPTAETPESEPIQIAYQLREQQLIRLESRSASAESNNQWQSFVLLNDITEIKISTYRGSWQPIQSDKLTPHNGKAIRLELTTPDRGTLYLDILLPEGYRD